MFDTHHHLLLPPTTWRSKSFLWLPFRIQSQFDNIAYQSCISLDVSSKSSRPTFSCPISVDGNQEFARKQERADETGRWRLPHPRAA
jgi:hypothetical protein